MTKIKGKVKWFNNPKGYGFIVGEDHRDYFVHYSKILGNGHKTLLEAQEVVFEPLEGPKGLTAGEVEIV